MRIGMKVTGIGHIKRKLGASAANDLERAIELDVATETRKMAGEAADNAPIETGALRASIRYSVRRGAPMTYYFGSYLPYALRQEYEHIPRNGYMRRAYWKGTAATGRTIKKTISRKLRG